MVRPRKSETGEPRDVQRGLRLTHSEAAEIERRAERAGMSFTDYVVSAALNWEPPAPSEPPRLPDRLQHLIDRGAVNVPAKTGRK